MLTTAVGLHERGHEVRLACAENSVLGERGRQAGLPVDEFRFHGDLDPALSWRYWRLCRHHRIEIFCLNMDKVLRVAGLAARLAGATVIPRRGSDSPVGNKLSHKFVYLQVAHGVIANSQATRGTMLSSATWLPPSKIRVIYNGIKTEQYAPQPHTRTTVRAELGFSPQDVVLGMVGELTERKNHRLILQQMPALLEHEPHLHLMIIGEGQARESLQQLARDLGIEAAVRWLGFRRDVPRLLQGIDIFCHPALREGFGYVIVEAMATGLPVIVANTSNLPEIVTSGQTGFLCDPTEGHAWRQKILELINDQQLATEFGRQGILRAQERFSFSRMLDELEDYFQTVRSSQNKWDVTRT